MIGFETRSPAPEEVPFLEIPMMPGGGGKGQYQEEEGRPCSFLFCDRNAFMYLKNMFHQGKGNFWREVVFLSAQWKCCDGLGLLRSQSQMPAGLSGVSGYRLCLRSICCSWAEKEAMEAKSSKFPRGWKSLFLL